MTIDTVFCQLYFRGGAVTIHKGSDKKCCCCTNAAAYTAIEEKTVHRAPYGRHPLCREHRASKIDDYAKPVIIAAAPKVVKPLSPWIRSSICIAVACLPMACAVVKKLTPEPNNYYSPAYNPPLVFTPVSPYAGPSYTEQRAKSTEETQDAIDKYRQRK